MDKQGVLGKLDALTRLLHSPRDPSSLAVVRILYGVLMMMDGVHERGLSSADSRWGDPQECRFPLLPSMRPPPLHWMLLLYALMMAGAAGIAVGFRFRLSCACFLVPYWYILLLDTSRWNNHSYLFGLMGAQLMVSGANRCWSLDAKGKPHQDVPLWNYALLRGQLFLVYFIAGLKKTNLDWIGGYSMEKLGYHWVFDGFRLFLDGDQVTRLVVHVGGFLLDLSVGFLLLLDSTRPCAFLLCGLFNLMNSRMFHIGVFPYVMIAAMPVFCSADWPKRLTRRTNPTAPSHDCIDAQRPVSGRHRTRALLLCAWLCAQGLLPFSHPLTPGLNTWTQHGLYGYSWDMMVHHWRHVHTTVTVRDRATGHRMHVDPQAWTRSHRWHHHAPMVKQFARCLHERLSSEHGLRDIEIFVDVWTSLNGRFAQRMYDPNVDILTAPWSPFEEVTWVLPLQTELSPWRKNLTRTEDEIARRGADVLFVADFPGLHLVNFVSRKTNTSLHVMKGSVHVLLEGEGVRLEEGQSFPIPSGAYHRVSPAEHSPACYMYVFNRTEQACGGGTEEGGGMTLGLTNVLGRSLRLIGGALYSVATQTPMLA